jgi:hypothetical protein
MMSLNQDLDRRFDELAASSPDGGARQLRVDAPSGQLRADLLAIDGLACAFGRLSLHTDRLATADVERLQQISRQLAQRLTYLLEPICPLESDAEQVLVQSRSNPPSRDEQQGICYYELLAQRGGSLTLARYCKRPGSGREPIPAQVTREVFCRLANDLVASTA